LQGEGIATLVCSHRLARASDSSHHAGMDSLPSAPPASYRKTCARCGGAFDCTPGACWCSDETVRLPMPSPDSGEDCLCAGCLRAAATRRSD